MMSTAWYAVESPEQIDSPALLVYPERIRQNIATMIRMAGSPKRLRPHVKTHKMAEVVKMQLEQGIRQFKCATIAEAEMLADAGAQDILLAYQLPYTKVMRLMQLVKQYPEIRFASLVDNLGSARLLSEYFSEEELMAEVWIDVDNGMHRTGHAVDAGLLSLYKQLMKLPHVLCRGFHIYDGHLHAQDFSERRHACDAAFAPVKAMLKEIANEHLPHPAVIAGGTPTFPAHALRPEVVCSPGTCLLWDEGYRQQLPEQAFDIAALLLTRIISKPVPGLITIDLGHKAVAAENPLSKRVAFLNLQNYELVSQSEEHLVIKISVEDWQRHRIGDVLYAVPYHICPTVALYDEASVIIGGQETERWKIPARRRRITV